MGAHRSLGPPLASHPSPTPRLPEIPCEEVAGAPADPWGLADRQRALSPQRFHKPHHLWKIATPFASHAFHPVDGFMQSLPYHIYPFLFPLHKVTYLGLYIFVNVWTISIHDGDYRVPRLLRHVINGSAHHTDHHLYFDYNYGQYFTLWDKIGGSYKSPTAFEGKGPHDYLRRLREKAQGGPDGPPAAKTD